jgi:hypothetical protein
MRRSKPWLAGTLRLIAVFAALIALTGEASADTYYSLEMDPAKLTAKGLREDKRVFPIRREGGGTRAKIVRDASAGSKVLELNASPTPTASAKDRSELRIYSGINFNRTWFLGMRVRPIGIVEDGAWHLFMQCHQTGSQLPPPLSLNLETGDRFSLIARSSDDAYERLWTGPMPQGKWTDIIMSFRMGEKGYVRLWVNGRSVTTQRVPLRWDGFEDRCVLKTGIYRAASKRPFQMRFDNIRLGDSYRDVAQ